MKKLLLILFSLFFLSSPSVFAEDISDFQIERISIGDSLLDYMTEDEILREIEGNKDDYLHKKDPNKYVEIYLRKDFPTYSYVSFFIKNNSTNKYITNKNEEYTILSIYGSIDYEEDFDSCIVKRDEIAEELSMIFPSTNKLAGFFEHSIDPSGNSIVDYVYFEFDSGAQIEASCDNFEETLRLENNWSEGLNIAINNAETTSWLRRK